MQHYCRWLDIKVIAWRKYTSEEEVWTHNRNGLNTPFPAHFGPTDYHIRMSDQPSKHALCSQLCPKHCLHTSRKRICSAGPKLQQELVLRNLTIHESTNLIVCTSCSLCCYRLFFYLEWFDLYLSKSNPKLQPDKFWQQFFVLLPAGVC